MYFAYSKKSLQNLKKLVFEILSLLAKRIEVSPFTCNFWGLIETWNLYNRQGIEPVAATKEILKELKTHGWRDFQEYLNNFSIDIHEELLGEFNSAIALLII